MATVDENLIIDVAYRRCTCVSGRHWVTDEGCVENLECDDLEYYHRRTNECMLKT